MMGKLAGDGRREGDSEGKGRGRGGERKGKERSKKRGGGSLISVNKLIRTAAAAGAG